MTGWIVTHNMTQDDASDEMVMALYHTALSIEHYADGDMASSMKEAVLALEWMQKAGHILPTVTDQPIRTGGCAVAAGELTAVLKKES